MIFRNLKFLLILFTFLYHSSAFSKTVENKDFNQRYLSNYFSAQVSHKNGDNDESIKYFESTKSIFRNYPKYFDQYIESLVLNGDVRGAIKQVKFFGSKNHVKNFQTTLLFTIQALKNKNFDEANIQLVNMQMVLTPSTYEQIIYQILKSFNQLFLNKQISEIENYGKLSKILSAFQYCYLGNDKANNYFTNLINLDSGDYSRYLFFYLSNLIDKNEYELVKKISLKIEPISSTLLLIKSKEWIDELNFDKFSNIFSCKSENDILAELFFLISNLYSSQEDFDASNFYLNISNYLNQNLNLIYL